MNRHTRARARQRARDRIRTNGWMHPGTATSREYAQRNWRAYVDGATPDEVDA